MILMIMVNCNLKAKGGCVKIMRNKADSSIYDPMLNEDFGRKSDLQCFNGSLLMLIMLMFFHFSWCLVLSVLVLLKRCVICITK